MFGLIHGRLVLIFIESLASSERTLHESFQLVDSLEAILQIFKGSHVLEQFFGVGIAADFDLFNDIDVSLSFLSHYYQLYNGGEKREQKGGGQKIVQSLAGEGTVWLSFEKHKRIMVR